MHIIIFWMCMMLYTCIISSSVSRSLSLSLSVCPFPSLFKSIDWTAAITCAFIYVWKEAHNQSTPRPLFTKRVSCQNRVWSYTVWKFSRHSRSYTKWRSLSTSPAWSQQNHLLCSGSYIPNALGMLWQNIILDLMHMCVSVHSHTDYSLWLKF